MKKLILIFIILFSAFLLITPKLLQANGDKLYRCVPVGGTIPVGRCMTLEECENYHGGCESIYDGECVEHPSCTSTNGDNGGTGKYNLITNVPGVGEIEDISDYIKALYLFGLAIVGVIAMLFVIIGGIRYMTAAGNESTITEAKGQITAAILGLVLLLTSWLILNTINPELVSLKNLTVSSVNTIASQTRWVCSGSECIKITDDSGDPNECQAGQLCFHNECKNGTCERIMELGGDECDVVGTSCSTYLFCDQGNICKRVAGTLSDQCSESEIGQPCSEEKIWMCCTGGGQCLACKTKSICEGECLSYGGTCQDQSGRPGSEGDKCKQFAQ